MAIRRNDSTAKRQYDSPRIEVPVPREPYKDAMEILLLIMWLLGVGILVVRGLVWLVFGY